MADTTTTAAGPMSISIDIPNKSLVIDCAMKLYSNYNFEREDRNESPLQIAKKSISRALILVSELQKQKLIS